jgi:predicted nucleic acid-binding protein
VIVVADSGPLHYLILIAQAELLERLYGRVIVPEPVRDELRAPGTPAAVSEWVTRAPAWVEVVSVAAEQVATITGELDLGERAALALADAIHADLLLIDDAAGREEARRRNLRVTGTLGVLRAGAELGILDVPQALSRLAATSFYADETLIASIFARWLQR